jgi:hypothetical protein
VFQSVLGLGAEDAEVLREALLQAVQLYDAVPGKANQQGQKYVLDFPLTVAAKPALVRSAWIVRWNENFPRLVTCYVL